MIPWSPAQLDALDMIWLKAQIHIYRLNERIPRAPLFLGTVHGGLGSPAAVEYLMKELAIHIEQCTQREDELNSLILHATREEVKVSGFLNLELFVFVLKPLFRPLYKNASSPVSGLPRTTNHHPARQPATARASKRARGTLIPRYSPEVRY